MTQSHLEYAQTVWSPHKKTQTKQKHTEMLEAVHWRAIKILPSRKKIK
jgi:hypothetical protein